MRAFARMSCARVRDCMSMRAFILSNGTMQTFCNNCQDKISPDAGSRPGNSSISSQITTAHNSNVLLTINEHVHSAWSIFSAACLCMHACLSATRTVSAGRHQRLTPNKLRRFDAGFTLS